MEITTGTTLGGYRIERRLGSGGMGTVYLAQHPRLPRKDAVKVLSDAAAGDGEFHARFLREAEIAARLHHPNLVAIRDRGEDDGRLWIAMQYVDGIDVAELIRREAGAPDAVRAVHILTEAARGLDEIHRAGLVHRDVKPANILLAEQPDGADRVLVTDFGIARPADDSATLASTGGMAASLAYASPEQLSGEPLDRRTDVYSLGCTLFQMLTGSAPFPRNSPGAVMYAHLYESPPPVSRWNPRLPTAFDTVIATAMAKDRDARYASCGELAAAARAALGLPGPSPVAMAPVPSPGNRRLRAPAIGAALASVLLAVAVPAWLWFDRDEGVGLRLPQPVPAPPVSPDWGAHAYMVEPFPQLLPYSPDDIGYGELTLCKALDERNGAASFDRRGPDGHVQCFGDRDPLVLLRVHCNADRTAMRPVSRTRVEGEERWSRSSGSGTIRWSNFTNTRNDVVGRVEVYFDTPDRNFCRLEGIGGVSGSELQAGWWPDVPV
ncbi:serine/threonine-protein kinase [Nocardia mexicana]|uniref:non-specific serine/threonine protein kinase n=1 Tax=Nocardia mexicana TaxID=279262 RepID=A0A370H495_9NOCA|nr:serine/threonine-protein kinase [Nocardia mexicana]RDI50867.1 serine/threonine-protein kinase [Nocardia mexicana]